MSKRVTILQYRLLHYRLDLFEKIKKRCAESDIALRVIHGNPSKHEASRNDIAELDWSTKVANKYLKIKGTELLWQKLPNDLKSDDLVVMMQENRILSNYPILFHLGSHSQKTAFWGHGENFQSLNPAGYREKWKKQMLNKVDWWFAYTQATVNILTQQGYPTDQITNLNNAVDTSAFKKLANDITEQEISKFRGTYGIPKQAKVGLYCGSLYPGKKLSLLIEASERIKSQQEQFHLIIVGDGPQRDWLEQSAKNKDWIHITGSMTGRSKALTYKLADIILNPGSLGLHILDAFCLGKPLFSTKTAMHGPEICYLSNGVNGVLTESRVLNYSDAVINALSNPETMERISINALHDSEKYTLDSMADNFASGIRKVLSVNN